VAGGVAEEVLLEAVFESTILSGGYEEAEADGWTELRVGVGRGGSEVDEIL
jgi:hypothetical protein